MKIYSITHKPTPYLINDLYEPFQVNALQNGSINSIHYNDALDENISNKNDNYCELTATYWLWKNNSSYKNIGICHYRRYFNFFPNKFSISPNSQKRISLENFNKTKVAKISPSLQKKFIENILNKYDIILPLHRKLKSPIYQDYVENHRGSDIELAIKIIEDKYPEYKQSIENYLKKNNKFHCCNMIICPKNIWDDYHKWLFEILFELEKNIIVPEDDYQKRIFGFLSERLLNLYVFHHKFKIKEFPLYLINE